MQVITISNKTTTAGLLAALFAAVGLLIARGVKNAMMGLKLAKVWLITRHKYADGDGGVIEWTGAQYIVFALAVCVAGLLLSIKY